MCSPPHALCCLLIRLKVHKVQHIQLWPQSLHVLSFTGQGQLNTTVQNPDEGSAFPPHNLFELLAWYSRTTPYATQQEAAPYGAANLCRIVPPVWLFAKEKATPFMFATFSQHVLRLEPATFCSWACFCKRWVAGSFGASGDLTATLRKVTWLRHGAMGTQTVCLITFCWAPSGETLCAFRLFTVTVTWICAQTRHFLLVLIRLSLCSFIFV